VRGRVGVPLERLTSLDFLRDRKRGYAEVGCHWTDTASAMTSTGMARVPPGSPVNWCHGRAGAGAARPARPSDNGWSRTGSRPRPARAPVLVGPARRRGAYTRRTPRNAVPETQSPPLPWGGLGRPHWTAPMDQGTEGAVHAAPEVNVPAIRAKAVLADGVVPAAGAGPKDERRGHGGTCSCRGAVSCASR